MPQAQDDDLVMSLVEMALSQPPDTQEAYLRTACGGDPELFSQVWDYVRWNHRMQDFLLEPLFPALPQHQFAPGDLLADRFRIVREVAQGGMGIVYEARDEKLGLAHRFEVRQDRIPPASATRSAARERNQPSKRMQDFRDPHRLHTRRRNRFSHHGVSGR